MVELSQEEIIAKGREVLKQEAASIEVAAGRLNHSFAQAVALIVKTTGKVVCTGLGKSGHVARKIAATMASTGTPAFFLHPAEALHGDLGMVTKDDCLLAIAYGGETQEVLEVARYSRRHNIPSIVITGKAQSSLAALADVVLDGAVAEEACPHNLAPTNSSTLAMALGDALAVALMAARGFSENDFARYHPSGSLGRRLSKVGDLMRPATELTTLKAKDDFAAILSGITNPNFGIVAILDDAGRISGAITDGDLRRALARHSEKALRMNAGELMTSGPKLTRPEALAVEAFKMMEQNKITSLFVTQDGTAAMPLLGLIRMHDLLEQKII